MPDKEKEEKEHLLGVDHDRIRSGSPHPGRRIP